MVKGDWGRVKTKVPYVDHGRWGDLLEENPDVLHRIIADAYDVVLRDRERQQGVKHSGRRFKPTQVPIDQVIQDVFPQQYSAKPFREALVDLMAGQSQTQFARKVPCNQATLSKLLRGTYAPDIAMMERIALAGGQGPWYFHEWRAAYVASLVEEALLESPSTGVQAVRALRVLGRRQ